VADLGKVYGLPAHEVHRATKLLHHMTSRNLEKSIAGLPEARDAFPVKEEPYRTIPRMAHDLEGLPRHWSMHPCGLVISPEPLTDLVPVQPSKKGDRSILSAAPPGPFRQNGPVPFLVAQYDMDAIEDLGFIKIDLLGQAGLSVLRDAVAEIDRTEAIHCRKDQGNLLPSSPICLERDVDYSDADTWELIATGNARGVHHIESPAMTSLIRQVNCRDIDTLTTVVALIRPGAANHGKKEMFARRMQGLEPSEYAHPSLVPILEKTCGMMMFEEHILQIAVDFAGINVGRADVLRRALNKDNHAMIQEMRGEFYAEAARLGRARAEIDAVWTLVQGFAGFMFNKAHSAEYAIEAFQGAWLKLRWPAHYLAAILSNYRGFYAHSPTLPQILYVLEALRLGIEFLPPCVNRSRERFSVETAINGLGPTAINCLGPD
jgi:DNA polymerase-3 subunit alpha